MTNKDNRPDAELRWVQAEKSLRESEEKYRLIFDNSPLGLLHFDAEGVITACNDNFVNIIGSSRTALIRLNMLKLPDQKMVFAVKEALSGRHGYYEDDYHSATANKVTPVRAWFGSITGTDGHFLGGTGIIEDITELKRAEKALQASEAKYKFLIDNANDIIWIFDPKTMTYTFISNSVERILGYTHDEAVGMTLDDVFSPETKKQLLAGFGRIFAGEASSDRILLEAEHVSKDGRRIWMEINAVAQKDERGKLVAFNGVTRDISERKQAAEALEESRNRLYTVIQTEPECVKMLAPDGTLLEMNAAGLRMIEADRPEDVIGKIIYPLVEPAYRSAFLSLTEQVCGTGIEGSLEFEIVGLKGTRRWLDMHAVPFRDRHGKIISVLSITRDISDRHRAEAARESLQAQLTQAQKMESVGRLAGGVAHDFNNMLAIVLGYTELALEKADPVQPIFADLQEVRKAGERSADLTRQLLAFARKQTVVPRVIDLNITVEGMLKMLRRLIGENIDLLWKPGAGLWLVKLDPGQLDQILANLAVNARDAIHDEPGSVGKVTVETANITLDAEYCDDHPGFVPGEYVTLMVSDDGCGMDRETADKIFEPFFTTKEMGKGTGLGLSTVYGIVKQNNGFIYVYSEPGQGTTFKIHLPRHKARAAQMPREESAAPAAKGKETILLVEDEPVILKMVKVMLERLGYRVLSTVTPGEAIALAEKHAGEIHLLMTDVIMPEMNGRDLAKNIMSLYPNLKRLFMSGYTSDVIARQGVIDEGVNFIQKPFSIKDLGAKLREILGE